ncbi:MAG: LL-diaminopimelate aminotransferase, partial [Acidobacteria bacterium]
MRTAARIDTIPPYLFAGIDKKIAERRAAGADVISFGVGDPDFPTPLHIVEAGIAALRNESNHHYPSYFGLAEFRQAVARFYERRFSVTLDPDTEVLPLIGSKEGIAHLPVAFVDPGDVVLVPDPAYPVYEMGTLLAGGHVVYTPLLPENEFLPDFDVLDGDTLRRAKILWMNYPSNPCAAVASLDFFNQAVDFCRKHDLLLAHDAAYTEITFDGYRAPSILEADGARDVAIEFHSLSKTYNMTGWRIGMACGSAKAIEALGRVKTNIDSGIFNALQLAGIAALDGPQDCVAEMTSVYQRRRDLMFRTFESAGWTNLVPPRGSVFVWLPVPDGHDSAAFTELLLNEADVVVVPGPGYGPSGEGFV